MYNATLVDSHLNDQKNAIKHQLNPKKNVINSASIPNKNATILTSNVELE